MDTHAFSRLRRDFLKSPVEKWTAAISSVGAAVSLILLLVLVYLFVNLLVSKGAVPTYKQLTPAKKQEFAHEWAARSDADRHVAVQRLGLAEPFASRVESNEIIPTAGEWELRWKAGVYLAVRDRVNESAANAYLPENADADYHPQLGIISLVVRERHRWTGYLAGAFASSRVTAWTWNSNWSYLVGLFLLAYTVAVIRGVLLNALAYMAAAATLDTLTRLRRAVYFHTYRLGSLAVQTGGPGEVAGIVTRQVETVGEAVHAWLLGSIRYPVTILLLIAFLLLVHFWLAVSFLLFVLLVWVIGGQIAAYFHREARVGSRLADSALVLLRESMGLLRLVKCYQMERFNQVRVERQLGEYGRASWRRLRGEALARPMLGSVALLAGVALLYLAARSVLAGEFTVAGLVVSAAALVSLVPPVAGWFEARRHMRQGREAAEAIFEFLDRKGEAAEAADAEFLPALNNRMEFRQVTLKEPGTGRNLLENVSFAVPARSRVAIVGSDPTEKHALMYLIPRFLDPTSGEIRIEDKNIKWVTHESLRAQVAVVMQDDLTFSDSVAVNIGCGDPSYTLPQIIEAAKLAHAHQFIERLAYGYETRIGNQGVSLRPGERFRIALARALLRDPSVLIVEEPGGPIDEDTLALLDDTMERASQGRTIVFLAQRLSTLRTVDRVFLLRDGHLEASGSHRDLWQNNEFYRRLQMLADATAEPTALRT